MRIQSALRALAKLSASGETEVLSSISEATRICATAIGSSDVRLVSGDGARFAVYPPPAEGEQLAQSFEASMVRSVAARTIGGPIVYRDDGQPTDFAPADGEAGGTHLALTLWRGESLPGSVIARGPWSPEAAKAAGEFLEQAAPALAIMLDRVVDSERGQRIREHMEALSSVARVFTDAKDMQSVLQDVANAIGRATGFLAVVDVLNSDGDVTLRSTGADRYENTPLYDVWMRMTSAPDLVKDLILKERQPVILPDLHHDPRISEEARDFYVRASIVSGATFPLLVQERVIGLLRVGSLKPTAFPEATTTLLKEFAVQAALVVNAVHHYEEQARAEEAIRVSEERFRSLVQNASDLITVMDADSTITYQSPSIQQVLGWHADEIIGTTLSDLLHPEDQPRLRAFVHDAMTKPDRTSAVEARLRHRDGSWRHVEIVGTDRRLDAAVAGFIVNTRDVTERKKLEEQLRHQAYHDPLTKLNNRARFTERLRHALVRSERTGRPVAVLFMDLDNFKSVNDAFGHTVGDLLLIEVGRRIQACLRAGDTSARFGGDEFAILLEDIGSSDDAIAIAARIGRLLEEPHAGEGKDLKVTASIGIVTSGRGPQNADDLLRKADMAMYAAKGRGKAHFEVYEEYMERSIGSRFELLAGLPKAIEQHEIVLHYQPLLSIETGLITGFEALARWQHTDRGLLYPSEFISLAEESGAIDALGRSVLAQACQQAARWQAHFSPDPPLAVAINASVREFQQPAFAAMVAEQLDLSGLRRDSLVVEVTENAMMQDVGSTAQSLRELRELGVRIAIDDFGTGYSSLSYLGKLPIDILKMDKSFIEAGGDDRRLARAIVDLGKSLDKRIIAEGVETEEQLAFLRSLKVDGAQGYYVARPSGAETISELLGDFLRARPAA